MVGAKVTVGIAVSVGAGVATGAQETSTMARAKIEKVFAQFIFSLMARNRLVLVHNPLYSQVCTAMEREGHA